MIRYLVGRDRRARRETAAVAQTILSACFECATLSRQDCLLRQKRHQKTECAGDSDAERILAAK